MPPGRTSHKSRKIVKGEIFLSRQPSTVVQQIVEQSEVEQQMSVQQTHGSILNVTLLIQSENRRYDLGPTNVNITEENEVMMFDLISICKSLKLPGTEQLDKGMISILSNEETKAIVNHQHITSDIPVYIHIGQDPLPRDTKYKLEDYDQSSIEIRVRGMCSGLLDQIIDTQCTMTEAQIKKNKQSKQRSLAEVVERVALWRRLYTGFYDQNKTFVQMSLDKAANKVLISKKTLDDYLLQIRYGKRYGFDFNKCQKDGISKLRQFVKVKKDSIKKES